MHVKQIDVVEGLKKRKETFNGAAHSILVGKGLPYRVGRLYVILLAIRRFSCNRIGCFIIPREKYCISYSRAQKHQ